MRIVLFFLLLTSGSVLLAQQGEVTVIKDNRIDALVEKQGEVIPPSIKPEIDGYRIQLVFDSNKDVVNQARSRFMAQYPDVDAYIIYNAPNFILKVGDFRTKMEAEKIKVLIESEFPTSFIVKEKINLPRLEKVKKLN